MSAKDDFKMQYNYAFIGLFVYICREVHVLAIY